MAASFSMLSAAPPPITRLFLREWNSPPPDGGRISAQSNCRSRSGQIPSVSDDTNRLEAPDIAALTWWNRRLRQLRHRARAGRVVCERGACPSPFMRGCMGRLHLEDLAGNIRRCGRSIPGPGPSGPITRSWNSESRCRHSPRSGPNCWPSWNRCRPRGGRALPPWSAQALPSSEPCMTYAQRMARHERPHLKQIAAHRGRAAAPS